MKFLVIRLKHLHKHTYIYFDKYMVLFIVVIRLTLR